ncbi:MAG: ATP-binding protein [Chlamydiales bacterium]|nr:ATP-binding protein [Chlamydiales bacterium]
MYQRWLGSRKPLKNSFFLFGPRGTGKTHWIKTNFPNALYFDLLDYQTYRGLLSDPTSLRDKIPEGFEEFIILDEVQRIPELLNEVHRLIEEKRYRFGLTGSSARKLKQKGVNLLAGRAVIHHMHPLLYQELGKDFSLSHALEYGLLPSTFEKDRDAKEYLASYVTTYLREEVMQEGLIRNLDTFSRALEVASFSQGSVLNISAAAREAQVSRKVMEGYFSIMEDLLLATKVPVFTRRAKRKLINHAKFYFFDVGIYRTLRPMGPFDRVEEAEGAALETLFYEHLRGVNDYLQLGYTIYFWRTQAQHEVDFVLYGNRGLFGFEIKRAKTIAQEDLRSLKLFGEDYPEAKRYILYGGKDKLYFDGITALPFEQALKELLILLE